MVKVFISRPDGNVAWGFRLQGGFEYGEPLTLTNIVPNSPADGKIDPGDILIEIAGNDATYMAHSDALELIHRCGNALFLTLQKISHSYPSGSTQLWRSNEQQPLYNAPVLPPPPSMHAANIPRAPIFDADLIANTTASFKSLQSIPDNRTSYDQSMEISNMPDVLAKSFSHPGGPKPFTYIPRGLDLSMILGSARIKRTIVRGGWNFIFIQFYKCETFRNRQRQSRSNSEDIHEFDYIMNRRMIVPPEQLNQHHYASTNPVQPFRYATQQPTPPRKLIQHDTDVITQTRSFQMLQGWISDKEKATPSVVPSTSINKSAVTQAVLDEQNHTDRRSSSGGISSHPSRSFRYLQEQYDDDDTPVTTTPRNNSDLRRSSDIYPSSRTYKYSQDQHDASEQIPVNRSQAINNRTDLLEIYNKPPASFRAREPEARRFSGSTNPSRSFRFLQMMTEDDQQNDSKPVTGYTKPQQLLLNKYDEQNLLTTKSNEHPSRSFKYLQELTGEQQSTESRINTLSNQMNSTNLGESDF